VLIVNSKPYFFDHFIISQLSDQVHGLIAQELFTLQEIDALLVLLEVYPEYASYEALLAALSDKTLDQAREVVHEAMEAHNLDKVSNPLRNLLARCRPRLHDFGIDIASRRGLGYQLHRVEG